jgi:hypothetical protein
MLLRPVKHKNNNGHLFIQKILFNQLVSYLRRLLENGGHLGSALDEAWPGGILQQVNAVGNLILFGTDHHKNGIFHRLWKFYINFYFMLYNFIPTY